jgi:hypothetical protein
MLEGMRFRCLAATLGGTLSVLVACADPNLDEGSADPDLPKRTDPDGGGEIGDDAAPDTAPPPAPPPPAVCGPANCAGCCSAGMCFTDHTRDHCASRGVACPAACDADQSCVALADGTGYLCELPPLAASYSVRLVGGTVQNGADGAGDLPDVYVNKGTFGALGIARTSTIDNTLKPIWNASLGTLANAAIVGATLTVEVKDEDGFGGDDLIGTCTHVVKRTEVVAGKVAVPKTDCTGGVDAIDFTLTLVP